MAVFYFLYELFKRTKKILIPEKNSFGEELWQNFTDYVQHNECFSSQWRSGGWSRGGPPWAVFQNLLSLVKNEPRS